MPVAMDRRILTAVFCLCASCDSRGGAPNAVLANAGGGLSSGSSSAGGASGVGPVGFGGRSGATGGVAGSPVYSGGATSSGGSRHSGGSASAGAAVSAGGSGAVGGARAAGGSLSFGGATGSVGGAIQAGGRTGSGGITGTGGSLSTTGGRGGTGGATGGTGSSQGGRVGTGGTNPAGGTSLVDPTELAKSQCDGEPGPSYEEFFDNTKLATLNVTVDAAGLGGRPADQWLDALWSTWSHCPAFNWTPATFEYVSPDGIGNVTCKNVGMRLRGSWTRENQGSFIQIRGFKLDMQVLDTSAADKRRFADLNRLNILSIETDPTHMMQCISYKMMREFGIPAPLCNHLKIYVNGSYYGLLENVEQVNKGYARRHFGTNASSLYAASPSNSDCSNGFPDSMALLAYSGDSFSSYTNQYELTNATAADAEANLIPMLKCGDATQTPNDSDFRTCIAGWIDVEQWLRLIAAESVMPELQSFIGYYRNYYLHFTPDSTGSHGGRFQIWPWDLDTALHRSTCSPSTCDPFTAVDSLYGMRNSRAKLVTRLTTVFRSEYCAALRSFLDTSYKTTLVDEMAQVIEEGVSGEPTVDLTAWQAEVTAMRNHIGTRAEAARSQINASCQ